MATVEQSEYYIAYLIRCWLEGSTWRCSLEEVGSSEIQGFASLDELISYLLARMVIPPKEVKKAKLQPKE